jgi:hypothetical protein
MVQKFVPVICFKLELQFKFAYRLTVKKSPKYLGATENSTLYMRRLVLQLSLVVFKTFTFTSQKAHLVAVKNGNRLIMNYEIRGGC